MNIPNLPTSGGQSLNGKGSWFGGPNDSTDSGHTASGGTTKEPGIATYNRSTLGGYWRVTGPNGRTAVLKQTDLGPAPFTGRKIDVTYSALGKLGYNEGNFPTDKEFKAVYLGHNPGANVGSEPTPKNAGPSAMPGRPTPQFDQAGYTKASTGATIGKLFSPAERQNNPLFTTGILSTREPSRAEFTTQGQATAPPKLPGAPAGGITGASPVGGPAGTSGGAVKLGAKAPSPAAAAKQGLARSPQAQIERSLAKAPTAQLEKFGYTRQNGKLVPLPVKGR